MNSLAFVIGFLVGCFFMMLFCYWCLREAEFETFSEFHPEPTVLTEVE